MMRKFWIDLSSSLLVGLAIILATFLAVRGAEARWLVMIGPLVLALGLVCADVLDSRLEGPLSRPSWTALVLSGSVVLGSWLVGLRDPYLVKSLIPCIGIVGWITLFLRPESRRKACLGI